MKSQNSEISQSDQQHLSNPEIQIPLLKFGSTLSTKETTLTDRYLGLSTKFIPMRTERSTLQLPTRLKTVGSDAYSSSDLKSQYEEHPH